MKKFIMVMTIVVSSFSPTIGWAGTHDFNSLIDENLEVQKKLVDRLQGHLGSKNSNKKKNPNFKEVGKDLIGKTSENYAVELKDNQVSRKSSREIELEKRNFKRLSEEFKELR